MSREFVIYTFDLKKTEQTDDILTKVEFFIFNHSYAVKACVESVRPFGCGQGNRAK